MDRGCKAIFFLINVLNTSLPGWEDKLSELMQTSYNVNNR